MDTPIGYAYLHGFSSSAQSRKGTALAAHLQARGVELHLLELNVPSFAQLTYSAALSVVDALSREHPEHQRWRLVGSSMGAYLAARWAELHPDRVDRLVLQCPGFDLPSRWPVLMGADAMARWKQEGSLPIPDANGQPVAVHWEFVEDAQSHPAFPEVPCPTTIIHGTRDTVVPIDGSRRYAATRDHVRLVEVDDDHQLTDSMPRIAAVVCEDFGIDA